MIKSEYQNMFEAENTYWWYVSLHKIIDFFVRKTKKKENPRIFDAGCGTGRTLEVLQKYGYTEGIDYEQEAVKYSLKRNLKNISCADLNTWKNTGEKFDYIISADVICCTGVSDDDAVIRNFYDALNKGGYLILNLPAFRLLSRKHDRAVFVDKRYTRKKINSQLRKTGFTIKRSTYRFPFMFFVLLLKKNIEKITKDDKIESDLKELPKFINNFMNLIMKIENLLISIGLNFPLGSSVFVIAEKKISKVTNRY